MVDGSAFYFCTARDLHATRFFDVFYFYFINEFFNAGEQRKESECYPFILIRKRRFFTVCLLLNLSGMRTVVSDVSLTYSTDMTAHAEIAPFRPILNGALTRAWPVFLFSIKILKYNIILVNTPDRVIPWKF